MRIVSLSILIGWVSLISISLTNLQEYRVHAGYIYHFTRYIEWPTNMQSGDFVIGIVGDSDITGPLTAMAKSKKVGSQTMVIKRFSSATAATNCHMLFLPATKKGQLRDAVSLGIKNHTLIVTESKGLGKEGAGLNFIEKDGKLRFELNKGAIQNSGLKVSGELVNLSIPVE
ncbi:MAG: YfiR family protein [Salibacteraceae bacterium]